MNDRSANPQPGTADRILDAAASLFREKGFNGASMKDLAGAVGITKSSLYHHYPSKQALLAEIIEVTMSRVTPLVTAITEEDLPAAGRLYRALRIHTAESILERDYLACFSHESRYLSVEFMATHRQKKSEYEALFGKLIEDGMASGEFAKQDPALAMMAILAMCDGAIRRYLPAGAYSPEEIAASFAETAVRGLGCVVTHHAATDKALG